ncbi:MAG: hypothetical protein NTW21_37595 [Verrucomicrobia bacterium]|nr:hypothetical protein [Verrucomicrobiota bacterium]
MTATPKTIADYNEIRDTARQQITAISQSYRTDYTDRKARWEQFGRNPLSLTRPEAIALYHELLALQPIAEAFDERMLDYQLREYDKRFYSENAAGLVPALKSLLATKTAPRDGWKQGVVKLLQEYPAKLFRPAMTGAERDQLVAERDRKEYAAAAIEANIVSAETAIARYETDPSVENYSGAISAIGIISFA